jgi:hypothetical protein
VNKEIADMWIEALRSGKYQQTKGALEITADRAADDHGFHAGFCCLGVLCDLAVGAGVISRKIDKYGNVAYGTEDDMRTGIIPDAVVDWAGMSSADGDRGGEQLSLVFLNDVSSLTFQQIADVIEAEYETL